MSPDSTPDPTATANPVPAAADPTTPDQTVSDKLDAIKAQLDRMEERQVRTTAEVDQLQGQAQQQQVGSFGDSEPATS